MEKPPVVYDIDKETHKDETIPRKITNYNILNSGTWVVSLSRFPHLKYFCQKVTLPGISWTNPEYNTPLSDFNVAGDRPENSEISFEFNVDEDLQGWLELVRLAVAMVFPSDTKQYKVFWETGRPEETIYTDLSVVITDNSKTPIMEIVYCDCLLKSVSGLNLEIPTETPQPVTASASFNYSYFEVRELGRTDIKYSEKIFDEPEKKEYNTISKSFNTHGKLYGDDTTKVTWGE